MTTHRFFVDPAVIAGERFAIPAEIERQVRRVLRLRDGDRIVLLAGDGYERECRLDGGDCVVEEHRAAGGEPRHRLTVAQALLKGDGLETVVRQGTEIGVAAFIPLLTERCVPRDLASRRLERLRVIAREAAEQSERGLVPTIADPVRFVDVVGPGLTILAERGTRPGLVGLDPVPSTVVIGPEGGFTPGELEHASEAGAALVSLGRRILRSESVAAAAAAVILSRTGDFG
jgi:16S rRNA (uracil1498-N3)-methyltransferase